MKIKVRNSPKVIHPCCKKFLYSSCPFCSTYCRDHITCYQSCLSGCSNTVFLLLGSLWKSQAALFLLQQHSWLQTLWMFLKQDRKCLVLHACKVPPLLPASLFTPMPRNGEKSGHYITTMPFVRGALNDYTAYGTDFRAMMFVLSHFICKYWLCHLHVCGWLCLSVAGH